MSRDARSIGRILAALLAVHAGGAACLAIQVGEPAVGVLALSLAAAAVVASRGAYVPRVDCAPPLFDRALVAVTATLAVAALVPVLHPDATYMPPYTGLVLGTPGVAVAFVGFGFAVLVGRRVGGALSVPGWRRFWRVFAVVWGLGVTTLPTRVVFWLHRPLFDAALGAPARRVGLYPFAEAGHPPDSRGATSSTVFQLDPGWPMSGAGFFHVPPGAPHPVFNAGSEVGLGGGWWMYTTE